MVSLPRARLLAAKALKAEETEELLPHMFLSEEDKCKFDKYWN